MDQLETVYFNARRILMQGTALYELKLREWYPPGPVQDECDHIVMVEVYHPDRSINALVTWRFRLSPPQTGWRETLLNRTLLNRCSLIGTQIILNGGGVADIIGVGASLAFFNDVYNAVQHVTQLFSRDIVTTYKLLPEPVWSEVDFLARGLDPYSEEGESLKDMDDADVTERCYMFGLAKSGSKSAKIDRLVKLGLAGGGDGAKADAWLAWKKDPFEPRLLLVNKG